MMWAATPTLQPVRTIMWTATDETPANTRSTAQPRRVSPFSGSLGGYYESIYKPAIEQAGLQPLRADAEIFGQKLIDKLADNLRSALSDPEEAIFRVDEAA